MFIPVTLVPSTTKTASAIFDVIANSKELSSLSQIQDDARFYLNVTAVSGTSPTMDVLISALFNNVAFPIATFTQMTATGVQAITVLDCPQELQLLAVVGGTTPSFTFEIGMTR